MGAAANLFAFAASCCLLAVASLCLFFSQGPSSLVPSLLDYNHQRQQPPLLSTPLASHSVSKSHFDSLLAMLLPPLKRQQGGKQHTWLLGLDTAGSEIESGKPSGDKEDGVAEVGESATSMHNAVQDGSDSFLHDAPPGSVVSESKRLVSWSINLQQFVTPLNHNSHGGGSGDEGSGAEGSADESPDLKHTAGYFKLNRTHDSRMFFFYFPSRGNPSTDPVVVWMTGGPGCSSEVALFFENGPFSINSDNKSLSWTEFGWDKASNIIYVDQPINTGFSFSHDPRDMRHDEAGISQDMFEFLQEFFISQPHLASLPFFITGESYGGHYVPSVASRILQGNNDKEGLHINLNGIAVGNGLTQPLIQYASYPDFALNEGLISNATFLQLRRKLLPCAIATKLCGTEGKVSCAAAFSICGAYFADVFGSCGSGNLNVYDIREECMVQPLCYDFSPAQKFLLLPAVREALGVGQRQWQSCSAAVYKAMILDFMRDIEPKVPQLLEGGLRVLIYAGEKDFICNWLGNSRWVAQMEWPGQADFQQAPWKPFTIDGKEFGSATEAGPLSFLKVYDAGHMVPMNQPAASLEMLRRFLSHEPLGEGNDELPLSST